VWCAINGMSLQLQGSFTQRIKLGAQEREWYGRWRDVDECTLSDNEITVRSVACARSVANAVLMKNRKGCEWERLGYFKHFSQFRQVTVTLDHIACVGPECEGLCQLSSHMRYPYYIKWFFFTEVVFTLRMSWTLSVFYQLERTLTKGNDCISSGMLIWMFTY
jgi:hypothetical protein